MKDQLDRIEARLQHLIENSLSALIPWGSSRSTLVHELVDALRSNLIAGADGRYYAPNVYTLQVHPDRLPYWQADPGLIQEVANYLTQAASEAGILFITPPTVHLVANPTMPAQDVRVIPSISQQPVGNTAVMLAVKPQAQSGGDEAAIPSNAFLIVNGIETFPLRLAVVNIGRRLDNHLTLDDPRISRAHAQIRAIRGKFVLFDLNSTGGTFVNGQRVSRYDLNPGDVISLAGVPLIYGQDTPPPAVDRGEVGPNLPSGTTQSIPTQTPNLPGKKPGP